MNITFSFTTRLTMIAIISFLIFFIASLMVVYELGKKRGIKIASENNIKISTKAKPEKSSNQRYDGAK